MANQPRVPRRERDQVPTMHGIDARRAGLVVHLASLLQRGATIEGHEGARAIVSVPRRQALLPTVVIATAGLALYAWLGHPLFLVGAGCALLGLHRRLVAGTEHVRLLVRVDDLGRVTEHELGTA